MNSRYSQELDDRKRAARDAAARAKAAKAGRDEGQFVPWLKPVQKSAGWRRASKTARSLLMDIVHSGPNGRLSASLKYLKPFGWTSAGTVSNAVAELIDCGLLVQTRLGARPNRAAWYACTWLKLQHTEGLDIDAKSFQTGGYRNPEAPERIKQTRRTAAATAEVQMRALIRADIQRKSYETAPSDGQAEAAVAPSHGTFHLGSSPSNGAMCPERDAPNEPSDGACLDIASLKGARHRPERTVFGVLLRGRVSLARCDISRVMSVKCEAED